MRGRSANRRGVHGQIPRWSRRSAPRTQLLAASTGRRAFMSILRIRVSRKRIARLMSAAGLAGVSRKFVTTTIKRRGRQAPDLVDRHFTAQRPNLLWVADITYIPSWAGFLYLAVVLDACSRRIVGWSMATTLATRLVLDALNMALAMRRGTTPTRVRSTPPSSSATAAARPACAPRWGRSETPTTTRCARAFSPRWNASFSTGVGSRRRPRRGSRCSNSSRASTTRAVVIRRSGISPRSTTSVTRPIPTHISLPPCSRPPRTSPPGGPHVGPSLTAAARDGGTIVPAGMEEWLRRGPNKRIAPNRRPKCLRPDTLIPSPQPSTKPGQVQSKSLSSRPSITQG